MCPPSSCAVQRFTRFISLLSSRSDRSTYAPDESRLKFDRANTPIGAPCRDKEGAGSGISSLYLWARKPLNMETLLTPQL